MNHIFSQSKIIRISETASTNWFLLRLSDEEDLAEGTVLVTDNQTHGRGLAQNTWESEPEANLTFSVILYPTSVKASRQFILSKAISLAVYDFVSQYVTGVSVKWPNDVYVADQKIAGILIENFIGDAFLTRSIVGIGLNINQMKFISDAPNPISLRQLTGKTYPLDKLLNDLHERIAIRYQMIAENPERLDHDYLFHLYRFGKLSKFCSGGLPFEATITDINNYGMLEVTTTQGERKTFGFKEIFFM